MTGTISLVRRTARLRTLVSVLRTRLRARRSGPQSYRGAFILRIRFPSRRAIKTRFPECFAYQSPESVTLGLCASLSRTGNLSNRSPSSRAVDDECSRFLPSNRERPFALAACVSAQTVVSPPPRTAVTQTYDDNDNGNYKRRSSFYGPRPNPLAVRLRLRRRDACGARVRKFPPRPWTNSINIVLLYNYTVVE